MICSKLLMTASHGFNKSRGCCIHSCLDQHAHSSVLTWQPGSYSSSCIYYPHRLLLCLALCLLEEASCKSFSWMVLQACFSYCTNYSYCLLHYCLNTLTQVFSFIKPSSPSLSTVSSIYLLPSILLS
jgi:hypothetical protein